jgi:predicted MFS family arabinose efflux permease
VIKETLCSLQVHDCDYLSYEVGERTTSMPMGERATSIKEILPISIAAIATYSVGLWGLYIQPQLLIPLVERYNVTEAEIGQLYGVENFIYFIAILMVTVPATKYSRTKMALLGTVFILVGNIASAYAGSLEALMVYRAIVSLGGGLISGAGTAAVVQSPDPDRTFALSGTVYLLIFAGGHALIPGGLRNFGVEGIYLSMAIYGVIAVPAFFLLYPPARAEITESGFFKIIKDAPYRLIAIFAMSGLFIYELGQNAVFTYMDKLGEKTGMDADDRGMLLFLSSVAGLAGGALAVWMGTRYGRFWPLVGGLGLNILSGAMFTMIEDPDYYSFMMYLWDISYYFAMPYLMGTLASLDKEGRWAVAGDAFWNFSSTPGPVIATLIVTHAGVNLLAMWVLTSGAVGMALFCYTAKQSDKLGLEE